MAVIGVKACKYSCQNVSKLKIRETDLWIVLGDEHYRERKLYECKENVEVWNVVRE